MLRAAKFACLLELVSALGCAKTADAKNDALGHSGAETSSASGVIKQIVTFQSGDLKLHGVVYLPTGAGRFPAVLWNHGSWDDPMVAFDHVAQTFTDRGWVFFGPFRRGQGLSSSAGPYIGDEIARAGWSGGVKARAAKAVSLLTHEHLDDQLAAYAWLKQQPNVVAQRIAVAGNSFGGIEAILGAESVPYCAVIDAAGGSMSWAESPELRDIMLRAAAASRAPALFFQAENDFDLGPTHTLSAAMRGAGRTAEIKIYPAYGSSAGEGHNFAWLGKAIWGPDVISFLQRHCGG